MEVTSTQLKNSSTQTELGKYRPIIGLEIHVELNTKSKMFCQCSADYFGGQPNTHTCPVCLGMPGGLPVPNRQAIESTILLGQALNCKINHVFKFDRKHYFYPDLPKGYQISQYDEPIAVNGELLIRTAHGEKKFRIRRVHLEEDTGKLTHQGEKSLIDYNRGGVPLVEIVTEPDFDNADDVKTFLEELQVIVRYLGIANADMEKGDMRLEPNISVQLTERWPELPDYKVEVKNINSFKFVKKAIEYETQRHIELLEASQTPPQETRGYDSTKGITVSQRSKEEAEDYRYFPEPDIPVFEYGDTQLNEILTKMVELPYKKVERYVKELNIKVSDAVVLTRDRATAEYFEEVIRLLISHEKTDGAKFAQKVANALINKKISAELGPMEFAARVMSADKPVETDSTLLNEIVEKVVSSNQRAVQDLASGKNPNAIMFLVGQVMREMKGQADATSVRDAILKRLGK